MEQQELTVLSLIHEEVKGVRTDIKELRNDLVQTREEVAVLKDRSNVAKRWGGFGVVGSIIAGAISLLFGASK